MASPVDAEGRGRAAEDRAAAFLVARGFVVLARNVRTASGEIDLLCRDGPALVVVEVKARGTLAAARAALDARKARLLRAAAREARRRLSLPARWPLRFDFVAVPENAPPLHVRGAFSAAGPFEG
jgi:putative endonuclease